VDGLVTSNASNAVGISALGEMILSERRAFFSSNLFFSTSCFVKISLCKGVKDIFVNTS